MNQRLNNLTNEKDFENGRILIEAFRELSEAFSEDGFKRNKIKKSEELFVLNTAIEGYGNKKYHDALLEAFIEIRKHRLELKEQKEQKKIDKIDF